MKLSPRPRPRLALKREHLRALTTLDLAHVAGGLAPPPPTWKGGPDAAIC